jgi:putative transposase
MVVSDDGTELTSNAILKWQQERKVEWHYIASGKPMQNGLVEASRRVPQQAPLLQLAPCPPADRGMARRPRP